MDATTIRKWRQRTTGNNVYYQVFGIYKRRNGSSTQRTVTPKDKSLKYVQVPVSKLWFSRRICNLYALPLATAKQFGKPPPESKKRILETGAMSDIGRKDSRGKTTLLLADGAPCYKGLSKMSKLLLRQCNHSKGVFSVWKTVHGRGSIRVHTGGIDAYWTLVKSAVPNEIGSNVGGKPNKNLWMYMRSQQWRWECHDKDLLALTGQTLATLWTRKNRYEYPTRFNPQNTVRVHDRFFLGKKQEPVWEGKNDTGLWRHQHFIRIVGR